VIGVLLALAAGFSTGERLDYDVRYGPVTIGALTLSVLAPDTVRGQECYHFRSELELSRSLSWLFWARYRMDSWCRESDMVTLRYHKRTREPRYRADWTADFDPGTGTVTYSDSGVRPLPDSSRDMVALWYYFRTIALDSGDTVRARAHVDRKDYELRAAVTGSKPVRTAAGLFDCRVLVPSAGTPLGTVWLSDDAERLPVVIRTRFGGITISASLRKASNEEER